ncbi:unnamed protein product [Phytophthora fragariaefolia]|uniref:Unnamed protein product n=1 Tax=Phytophthora fragariaefolia TaxID=1490495 RepID=A0A9W6U0T0_9STRA|nr:unnamed protein product [Phytophthora fragariaefolia]
MLRQLHKNGLVHGDPRVPNVILDGEKPLWIDLMEVMEASPTLKQIDAEILTRSILNVSPTTLLDPGLMELIDYYGKSDTSESLNNLAEYNVSIVTLEKHLSPDYKADPKYRFYNGNHMESHLYEGIESSGFNNKLGNVLSTQAGAFKINIALGNELVSKTDPDGTRYFYPNLANTHVFNNPIAINSNADIQKKVISEIRSMELSAN